MTSDQDDNPPRWEVLEELLDPGDLPDPWADLPDEPVGLTPEQERFLTALSGQPDVPRLRGLSDEDKGSELAGAGEAGSGGPADDEPGEPGS